jgi:hypothetical protein
MRQAIDHQAVVPRKRGRIDRRGVDLWRMLGQVQVIEGKEVGIPRGAAAFGVDDGNPALRTD